MPIEALAGAVAMRFPDIGRELQLTVRAAHRTGGRAAEVFEEVADLVRVRAEIAHEIRIATAPARATAGILVIAPCLYLAYLISSGRLESLLAGVEQRTMVLIGLGLFGAGLAAAIGVMWRAR
jgi:Flp pilus assembly protein TadB